MDSIEMKKRLEAAHGNPGAVQAIVRETEAKRFASDILMAKIGLSIGALLVFASGGVFLEVAATLPEVVAASGAPLYIGGSFVFFALGVAMGVVAFGISAPPSELARTGIPAKVKVEDYRSAIGSMSVGTRYARRNLTRVAIDLTVSPWNQATYRVTIKQYLPGASMAALHVGATLDAFVDPNRRKRVLLVVP